MRAALLAAAFSLFSPPALAAGDALPLAGRWRFSLDRADVGEAERWFARTLPGEVRLPGDLADEGIGDPVSAETRWIGGIVDRAWFTAPEYAKYREPGREKVPFWLQPERRYVGAAWYQRDVEVPEAWRGKRAELFLERPHMETRVWVGERFVGASFALGTPHVYDLGALEPGRHALTIRVDNRMALDVGENSHCVSDHTQGNWNGIVGRLELRARPAVWIDGVDVYPHVALRSATFRVRIGNSTRREGRGTIEVSAAPRAPGSAPVRSAASWGAGGGEAELELSLGEGARLWDEFDPALQRATVTLASEDGSRDEREVSFGLREIAVEGTQFAVNGRRIFIRGTLECAIFPRTGHPPTEVEGWRRILRAAKAHGLNCLRFHSWCPPEAAFAAGDELGFYFQVETCWPNMSTTLGDGKPVDRWVYEETDRILRAYGNHPSFAFMAHGNEPGGSNAARFLARYVAHYKARDPRRLWTSGSGWPEIAENQFHVTPEPRIQAWGAGLASRVNAKPPETATDYRDSVTRRAVPVVSHEIGQWCVYPNFDEIPKYTGYLKPKNFEIFRDRLEAGGMASLAREFLRASGRLQVLLYKEDIESALRTPGMAGFHLLDLHDFPGQGTALVGVLDPFWEEKGYVTASEYRRFAGPTVPLARLARRVFTDEEALEAELEVAHFGPGPLEGVEPRARLVSATGAAVREARFEARTVPVGNGIRLGGLRWDLRGLAVPAKYGLAVSLDSASGAGGPFENDWDVWVYPARPEPEPPGVLVTNRFDAEARARLEAGGRVLLGIPGASVRNFDAAPVRLGFSSIFWNTAWTGRQAPTTLGILCDPKHPALAEFPTEEHANWQWWYLVRRAGALRLDLLPPGVEPIVRVIDDWFTARPLALIVEGRAARGRIVICGFDLEREADDPVSRQMRASLARHLASDRPEPERELSFEAIASLTRER